MHHPLGRLFSHLPTLIVGDFNDWRNTLAKKRFTPHAFHQATNGTTAFRSFPAVLPFLNLDKAFYRGGIAVREARILRTPLARRASDHLPLRVDFDLSGAAKPACREQTFAALHR